MRLRKQSKPAARPGDEFLRVVSSGRERQAPPAVPRQSQGDFSGMREQLLESERRAAAAGEALRQIREERDERLEQAREALARERAARLAAEQRLAEANEAQAAPVAAEPEYIEPEYIEPESELERIEPELEPAEPDPGLEFQEEDDRQLEEHAAESGQEGGWPAPWLEEKEPRRRGLFRRSRS